MYRRSNKSCLNCGGDTSVPDTTVRHDGPIHEVCCKACGMLLMRGAVSFGGNISIPQRFQRHVHNDDLDAHINIPSSTAFRSAEYWWSEHDSEAFINGVPIKRTLPNKFYAFRDAVIERHNIHG